MEDELDELPTSGPFRGSRSQVTRQQLRARRFRRLHRDVYVQEPEEASFALDCAAVLLAVPDAVFSHTSAARLWGLPVDDVPLVEITRAPQAAVCRRTGVRTHRARLAPDDLDTCHGQPVTSLARTFVDLARTCAYEELVAVGDVVLRRSNRADLEAAVARAGRRKGVCLAREALLVLDAGAASPGETRCRLLLHGAGFPDLRHAVTIRDEAGGWLAEADLGDARARVAVQYDGEHHLQGSPAQRAADIARDELARVAGWEVVVLTARDLQLPHLAVHKVRAAYARAAAKHSMTG